MTRREGLGGLRQSSAIQRTNSEDRVPAAGECYMAKQLFTVEILVIRPSCAAQNVTD
jgi:hypothetical protein